MKYTLAVIGTRPNTEDGKKFENSFHFDKEESVFYNRQSHITDEIFKRIKFSDYIQFPFGNAKDQIPTKKSLYLG